MDALEPLVAATGSVALLGVNTDELLAELVELRTADPDLSVIVRGDAKTKYHRIVAVLDALQQANVLRVDLATEVFKETPAQRN